MSPHNVQQDKPLRLTEGGKKSEECLTLFPKSTVLACQKTEAAP